MIAHLKISRGRLAFILGALAMLGPFSIDTVFPAFAIMGLCQDNSWLAAADHAPISPR